MATLTVSFVFFNCFRQDLGRGVHNLETDVIKAYLSNDAPVVATDTVKADVTEISTGNGYTGPFDVAATFSQSGGVATFTTTGATVVTATGDVGPFQYLVFYNDTASGDPLIGYMPWPQAITVRNLETFVATLGATFTIP